MVESTEQGGAPGNEAPTGDEAQAPQAQATATEQGGGAQGEAGTQQTGRPSYLDSMPDEYKNNEALHQFKNPGELAAAALKSLEGMKKPGADASPEELKSWHDLIGVPETADGYEFKKPEDLPEGMSYNAEKAAAFAADCHKAGIPKEHAQFMFDRYNAEMAAMFKAQGETLDAAIANNKKKLTEKYQSEFETVQKKADEIVFRLGGSEFLQGLEQEGLKIDVLTSPTMIDLFLKLEKAVVGDSAMPGKGGGAPQEDVERDERGQAAFTYPSMEGQGSSS